MSSQRRFSTLQAPLALVAKKFTKLTGTDSPLLGGSAESALWYAKDGTAEKNIDTYITKLYGHIAQILEAIDKDPNQNRATKYAIEDTYSRVQKLHFFGGVLAVARAQLITELLQMFPEFQEVKSLSGRKSGIIIGITDEWKIGVFEGTDKINEYWRKCVFLPITSHTDQVVPTAQHLRLSFSTPLVSGEPVKTYARTSTAQGRPYVNCSFYEPFTTLLYCSTRQQQNTPEKTLQASEVDWLTFFTQVVTPPPKR